MPVIFIIDLWKLDSRDIITVSHPREIPRVRRRIRSILADDGEKSFEIKFNSKSIYDRFSDFDGVSGVTITSIVPQVQLGVLLNERVPDWLTNSKIISLDLLNPRNNTKSIQGDSVGNKLLSIVLPEIFHISSVTDFYSVVQHRSDIFSRIINEKELYFAIYTILCGVSNDTIAQLALELFLGKTSPQKVLIEIGREQLYEKGKSFLDIYHVPNISFPPRKFDRKILKSLPPVELVEGQEGNVISDTLDLLENVVILISNSQLDPHCLASLIVPWPSFIHKLSGLLEENPNLATTALKEELTNYSAPFLIEFRRKVESLLLLGSYDVIGLHADVSEAVEWSRGYLAYAKNNFLQKREPNIAISDSFTNWFLAKEKVIKRSDHDWSIVSEVTENSLSTNSLTILCIVDALGAIHLDLIKELLEQGVEGVDIEDRLIFSPIPTLTEVCKMSVVTGKNYKDISNVNQQDIVAKHYSSFLDSPKSLQLLQSWKDFQGEIGSDTKLIVCFENRIDERLHKCLDFENHQRDVKQVIKSLVKDINHWLMRAAQLQKTVQIMITADHGSSCIEQNLELPDGVQFIIKKSERTCRVTKHHISLPNDYYFIKDSVQSEEGYITPLSRMKFTTGSRVVHGGLTAEEVLIPLVVIKKSEAVTKGPVILSLKDERGQNGEGGWNLELYIDFQIKKPIKKVYVLAGQPFTGREGPISPISAQKKHLVRFFLKSNVEQSGLISVPFIVNYQLEGEDTQYKFETELNVRLPVSLIDKNEGSISFDDMFN